MTKEISQKGIAILGSTGSIGTQTLEVISENPEHFRVELLTAGSNWKLLFEQAKVFKPNAVVICNEEGFNEMSDALWDLGIKTYLGQEAIADCVQMDEIDVVVTAMVGFAGLHPTIKAIEAGKSIALANKETLVVAGEYITKLAKQKAVNIYPVDSEHSAIFQCMPGEWHNPIEKITLTASGGPFRGKNKEYLQSVTLDQALKHPNWEMGAKITIDSATMMNKGLEVIEAKWLFGLKANQIDVVVHPESIVHSLVQFQDGSVKAQLGLPDMKLPILYAINYPNRLPTNWPRMDLAKIGQLNFEEPDLKTFTNLQLAFDAMEIGGTAPCVLNAANEISVASLLEGGIKFSQIAEVNQAILENYANFANPSIEDLFKVDEEVRAQTKSYISQLK